jgi:hypothetical protein
LPVSDRRWSNIAATCMAGNNISPGTSGVYRVSEAQSPMYVLCRNNLVAEGYGVVFRRVFRACCCDSSASPGRSCPFGTSSPVVCLTNL